MSTALCGEVSSRSWTSAVLQGQCRQPQPSFNQLHLHTAPANPSHSPQCTLSVRVSSHSHSALSASSSAAMLPYLLIGLLCSEWAWFVPDEPGLILMSLICFCSRRRSLMTSSHPRRMTPSMTLHSFTPGGCRHHLCT